ncbi:kinesin-domain-containing protein [Hesseltinella vesiculosa]|uniref:Kinesin-like protein n=1 Tax=Hesseltinella vesiculosa TaxID=101127 RepID=A0A1X2GN02_9FUNG|nr:kinesin-domain-containing protein [Hesseltinella vesiculosa]
MSPPTTPVFNAQLPISPTSTPSPSSSLNQAIFPPSPVAKQTPKSENIQVMVRCRPLSDKEDKSCWVMSPGSNHIQLDEAFATAYEFDKVFEGSNNSQVYESGIQDLVRYSMEGYNGTTEEPGVIPKAILDVFAYIEEVAVDREFLLQVSYLEIYNERINDLLNPDPPESPIEIRSVNKNLQDVVVDGLVQVPVATPEDVMKYIKFGEERRHTSNTDYNINSSRSHTIFQLMIESRPRLSSTNTFVRLSKLNLIDLAGSEKVASRHEQRQEGAHINRSLLTLGKVINSLNIGSPHIPYRESKLTRILQPSLSGNAHVTVICAINPAWSSKEESANTLRFAQGVKQIKIVPKITQVIQHSQLQNYKDQILELENLMQRKTEQEAEAKERLSQLLGLILTSSKANPTDAPSEPDNGSADWLHGSMGDVVAQCEQHLALTMNKYKQDLAAKENDLSLVQEDLVSTKKELGEKTSLIKELQEAIQEGERIHDEKERQLGKTHSDITLLNQRWAELEVILNDYKHRVVTAEATVQSLHAQRKADADIRSSLEQQIDDLTKATLVHSLDDLEGTTDDLCGMGASSTIAISHSDLSLSSSCTSLSNGPDHIPDKPSSRLQLQVNDLQQQLDNVQDQLKKSQLTMEDQQERHHLELKKERERTLIYKQKLEQVPLKISQLEEALKQLHASAPAAASSSTIDKDPIPTSLYLGNGSWVLLVAFGCWLFA